MPGRIVNGLRAVQVTNPVFLLDEVDKLVSSCSHCMCSLVEELSLPRARVYMVTLLQHCWRSWTPSRTTPSPISEFSFPPLHFSSSLLPLLLFLLLLWVFKCCCSLSSYLNIPYDLSQVLFIATANTTSTIPPALLDRMEVSWNTPSHCLHVWDPPLPAGYLNAWLHSGREGGDCISTPAPQANGGERRRSYVGYSNTSILTPQQHGLTASQLILPSSTLKIIGNPAYTLPHTAVLQQLFSPSAADYTREAGVRSLERNIASVCRAVAVKVCPLH